MILFPTIFLMRSKGNEASSRYARPARLRIDVMQIASGRVIDGRVVVGELPEEVEVTRLALDGEETFEVDAELGPCF